MADQHPLSESAATLDKDQVNPTLEPTTDAPSEAFLIVDPAVVEAGVADRPATRSETKAPQKIGGRKALLKKARSAVRAVDAPTWGLDLREINDGVEKARSRGVIDLAMRIAESMLSTGASAADVTANVIAVTKAYGLKSVHVDVTFTSIHVTHHRGAMDDPVTMVRIVRTRAPDYDRLSATHRLIEEITEEGLALDVARGRFFAIMGRPHLYRRWVITLSFVLLGGGVAALIGGTPVEIVMAALIATVVDRATIWAGRRRLAAFFGQMIGGAIPTTVAMAIVAARGQFPFLADAVRPSVLVATGIVMLLAGLSVVGAAQDAIDGYYVTAGARTYEVVMLTLGILVGVLAVISVASRLGVPAYLIPPSSLSQSVTVQIVAAAFISLSYALGCYAGLRTIVVSVVMGVMGWSVYVVIAGLKVDDVAATALACLVVGLVSQPSAWLFRVPSLAISTAGIVAFLPGSMVYRGLYYMVEPSAITTPATDGPGLLLRAAAYGLAISGGVSLGSYFGRRFRLDRGTAQSKASARALRRSSAPVAE